MPLLLWQEINSSRLEIEDQPQRRGTGLCRRANSSRLEIEDQPQRVADVLPFMRYSSRLEIEDQPQHWYSIGYMSHEF